MVMREQVLQGFEEQRALVDALTNVSVSFQLNNLTLKSGIINIKKTQMIVNKVLFLITCLT